MKDFLSALDKWVFLVIKYLMGISIVILTLIIFIQVVTRYIFKVSTGGLMELPTFLLLFAVWVSAAMNARTAGGHIELEFIELVIKNRKVTKGIKVLMNALTVVVLAIFTYLCWQYVKFGMDNHDISIGLQIPIWCVSAVLLVSSFLMTVYYILTVYKGLKEMNK